MLAYVKAENAYADAMLAHTNLLESRVYSEIIGRLQQDDSSVPYLMNGYWYFRRFETGKEYPVVWTVKHPKGRIVCITLGHDGAAHEHDDYRRLLLNATSWASGKK